MLGFLFRTLTAERQRGAPLFDAITAKARQPHWYVEGAVPDTIDGRFAVLSTLTALVLVRIEQGGEEGNGVSVALTERFVAVMESEHRELGLGDPTLGKTVRKLVGSLARRTELWRAAAIADERDWTEAAQESLYKDGVTADALLHASEALRNFWKELRRMGVDDLEQGRLQ
jgi:cytochrome b pre-mRNA-processing protein 3